MLKKLLILVWFCTLWAFSFASAASVTKTTTASVDLSCVKPFVETRESSIYDALKAYTDWVIKAFETRKSDFSTAWSLTDPKEMKSSIKKAISSYTTTVAKLKKDFKVAKTAAWTKFKADSKTCKWLSSTISSSWDSSSAELWM